MRDPHSKKPNWMHSRGGRTSSGEFLKIPPLLKQALFLMRTHLSHLLKRSPNQFYQFLGKRVKVTGDHQAPGAAGHWRTQQCFKKQRETSSRRAGREAQKTCIQVSMRFGFPHSLEHLFAVFSELRVCARKQFVVTPSLGVHHPNESPSTPHS